MAGTSFGLATMIWDEINVLRSQYHACSLHTTTARSPSLSETNHFLFEADQNPSAKPLTLR